MMLKTFKYLVLLLIVIHSGQVLAIDDKNPLDSKTGQIAGITPLMMAVSDEDINGINFFLSSTNNSKINQKNIGGATALHIATRKNNAEIIDILISNGANIDTPDNEGWTPLMRAANQNNDIAVIKLLNSGAKVDSLNSSGESAIIHSAKSGCVNCLKSILGNIKHYNSFGNSNILSKQISSAFIAASNRENQEIKDTLNWYQDKNKITQSPTMKTKIIKYSLEKSGDKEMESNRGVNKQSKKTKYVIKNNKSLRAKKSSITVKKKNYKLSNQKPQTHIMDLKPSQGKTYNFRKASTAQVPNNKKRYIFKRY